MTDKIYTTAVSILATSITGIQGATILNTDTLLPAGLWVGGLFVVWRASWRVCESVLTFLHRVDQLDNRLTVVESKCKEMHR